MGLPLALAGLVALPILGGIYLLRTRYRRQVVSALFLWQAVAQASGGGRKRSRMQASWPLLLELLALLLLVLAAAGPRVLAAGQRVPVVLVLDDSFSMAATADGVSARDRGLAAVRDELAGLGRFSVAAVVAGPVPARLAASARDAAGVEEALAAWQPDAAAADLDAGIALARETGGPDARLLVVTDRPRTVDENGPEAAPSADPDAVRWLAVGEAAGNAAVTLAVRSADGAAADTLLAEVTRTAPDPAAPARPVRVAVEVEVPGAGSDDPPAGWNVYRASSVEMSPGQTERFRVELPASAAGRAVRVRLAMAGDPLEADDAAVLAPGRRPAVVAASVVADPRLARAADAALAAAGTQRVPPSEAELVVANSAVPAPPGAWRLMIDTPAADAATESFLGPFLLDEASPLADGLSLGGLVWTAATDATLPGRPLATAGFTPLVSLEGDASAEAPVGSAVTARVNLDAARSTVLGAAAWPVLVDNLVRARRAARPGVAPANAPVGVAVALRSGPPPVDPAADPEAELPEPAASIRRLTDATGSAAAGEAVPLPLPAGVGSFAPDAPGLYAAVLPDGTDARFAVTRTSAAESDLSAAATASAGTLQPDAAEAAEYRGLAWALGLAALLVLGLEAWLVYGGSAAATRPPEGVPA
ncbi:BatA domain-containing protein [Phycisphaera mikurensis]|nr:BatA domain-containing protein [Phycisphaera mikurensis]